ncbi:MAG: MutT/nudix family phosphohydrolase [Parcubacteria group bacterium GW2011_GWA2_40_23]|nr:MAG: MutT/nudix family phosphohydrolase [Parcubacteria group bacterium GW2011_GWA2_40_23]
MKTRVRAIIIRDNKVLFIHRIKENEEYWVFPGGGVEESDESFEGALIRECTEELGIKVKVGQLFCSNQIKMQEKGIVEMFFFCEQIGGILGTGTGPEYKNGEGYTGRHLLEWIELGSLSLHDVRPRAISEKLFKEVN